MAVAALSSSLTTFPPVTADGRRSEPSPNVLERIGSGSSVLKRPNASEILDFHRRTAEFWPVSARQRRLLRFRLTTSRRSPRPDGTQNVHRPGWNASDLIAPILSCPTRPRLFVSASGRRSSDLFPRRGGGGAAGLPCTYDCPAVSAAVGCVRPPPIGPERIGSGSPEPQLPDTIEILRFGHRTAEF